MKIDNGFVHIRPFCNNIKWLICCFRVLPGLFYILVSLLVFFGGNIGGNKIELNNNGSVHCCILSNIFYALSSI